MKLIRCQRLCRKKKNQREPSYVDEEQQEIEDLEDV